MPLLLLLPVLSLLLLSLLLLLLPLLLLCESAERLVKLAMPPCVHHQVDMESHLSITFAERHIQYAAPTAAGQSNAAQTLWDIPIMALDNSGGLSFVPQVKATMVAIAKAPNPSIRFLQVPLPAIHQPAHEGSHALRASACPQRVSEARRCCDAVAGSCSVYLQRCQECAYHLLARSVSVKLACCCDAAAGSCGGFLRRRQEYVSSPDSPVCRSRRCGRRQSSATWSSAQPTRGSAGHGTMATT